MAIWQRGPRRWRIELVTGPRGADGKYPRRSWTIDGTRRDAEREERRFKAEIEAQHAAFVDPTKDTVAQYLAGWLERKRAEVADTTAESYARMARVHIVPALGAVRLADLSPAAVQGWVDAMSGRVSARTASYARTVLRIAMQDATMLGLVAANPVDRTRGPRQEPRKVAAFTLEQCEALFARATGSRLEPLLRFAAFSGLRRGEVLGLRWADVDMQAGTVSVRQSRVALAGKSTVHAPKTEAGTRTITVPGAALDALRARWAQQAADRLKAGAAWRDEGWVFATAAGGPLDPNNVSRDFRRLRDAARLQKEPFHALRHTAVSVQLAAGVPLEVASKRIGHKRTALTADTYGHMLPQADQAAAGKVDDFLRRHGRA